jgi:hypothetical protein
VTGSVRITFPLPGPGPYEHAGPYVDGEFFDTTGTVHKFCPDCEHAPCVAGHKYFCSMHPRNIVSSAIEEEIGGLLDQLATVPRHPLERVLRSAVFALSLAPSERGLADLALIRGDLRELVDR